MTPKFFNPFLDFESSKHNLPHRQQSDASIFITYRLADSLPQKCLNEWRFIRNEFLKIHPKPWNQGVKQKYYSLAGDKIDYYLDQNLGSCLLREPIAQQIIKESFLHFNHKRYEVDCFVVMPNHIHILYQLK